MTQPSRTRVRLLWILALAGVYFVAGTLGLRLAFLNASATAVWAPTGIALAAVLVLGPWVWPGIAIGAFLVNATTSGSVPVSAAIAVGNTLEALAGGWLVNRWANGSRAYESALDIARYASSLAWSRRS
jgi:integral membrane sensor domain MASE1